MFIERLINQGNAPLAEQVLKFTAARQKLLIENVANVSTPGYRSKDLDEAGFYSQLRARVVDRRAGPPGATPFNDVTGERIELDGLLFHDQNNRSMEQLATDSAKNALMHNLVVELLRKQFNSLENALKERLS